MRFLLPIFTLLIAIFMLMAGSGAIPAFLGLRLNEEGVKAPIIALVGASYFVGLTVGSMRVFGIIRRVGHIRAFAAFVSLYSASILSYSLVDDVPFWIALRFIDGFCVAGVFVCLESWLNDRADPERRGTTLAFYMIALYGGQALSQGLLGLDSANAQLPFLLASLVLSLTVLPVALTQMAGPAMEEQQTFSLKRLYAISPLGLVGSATTGVMLGAFYAMGAVQAQRIGMSNVAIAWLMSAVIAGGMALQWPLGRLSDRFDRRKVIVVSLAVTAAICAAMTMIVEAPLFTLLGALFGGFSFALYPLCVSHTNDHVEPGERMAASGGLILVYSMGAAAGPLVGSFAMMLLGPGALYGFIGLCAAAAFLFGLWRQLAAAPVPSADQHAFQILPRTTPMVAALDPELEPAE